MMNAAPPELKQLTAKQRAFALEYVKHRNGKQAARAAGYGGSDRVLETMASKLVRNGKVADAITALTAPALERAQVTTERVIEQLAAIAFAPWQEFIRVGTSEEGGIIMAKMRLSDKLSALFKLGEWLGMFRGNGAVDRCAELTYSKNTSADERRRTLLNWLRDQHT